MLRFLDTSAILNGALKEIPDAWISPLVVRELENIKNADRPERIKYLAREAVRDIITSNSYNFFYAPERKVTKYIKRHSMLMDIPDHRLLAEAAVLREERGEPVQFVTSDGALYIYFNIIKDIDFSFYAPKKVEKQEYTGWKICHPTDLELISLYSHPEINVLELKTNEFAEIYEDDDLKDILFWDGLQYSNLKYQSFKSYFGDKIAPRNIEQKMLFHLLQNQSIKIKVATGHFGTGKSMLMLQHALKGVKEGRFQKIVFVRNNIITKGSRDIGYLSGDLVEKIKPYLMPIADLTSEDYLDELIMSGTLEPVPLGFMRGRDFSSDVLVFVDEAENLTKENVQLLIGRVGVSSEIWFAGDLKQIDHKDFEKNNGLDKMIRSLAGNELFGMVKLMKAERSRTSQLADLMD